MRRPTLRMTAAGLVATMALSPTAVAAELLPRTGVRDIVGLVADTSPVNVQVAVPAPAPRTDVLPQAPEVKLPPVTLPQPPAPPPVPSPPRTPDVPIPPDVADPPPSAGSDGTTPPSQGSPAAPAKPAGATGGSLNAPAGGSTPAATPGSARGGSERRTSDTVAGAQSRGRAGPTAKRSRLVRTVTRFDGCLAQVGRDQRRVLTLRVGIGPGPALSRVEVAQRLAVDVSDVARLERRGVRRLETLARGGGCAGGGSSYGDGSSAAVPGSTPSDPSAQSGDQWAGAPQSGVEGVSASGGARNDDDGSSVALPVDDPGVMISLLLLAAGLGAFALAVRHEMRRR